VRWRRYRRPGGRGVTAASDGGRASGLAGTVFATTVAQLAVRHHLDCSVHLQCGERAAAVTVPAARRIDVTDALLSEFDEGQAWIAAHEFGHLVSARDRGVRFYPLSFILLFVVAGIFGPAAGVLVGPALAGRHLPVPGQVAAGLAAVLVLAVVELACAHLALIRLGAHQRPLEEEADDFAKAEGHPVTPAIVAMLERHEAREARSRLGRLMMSPRYRQHASPADRLNSE